MLFIVTEVFLSCTIMWNSLPESVLCSRYIFCWFV